MLTYALHTAGCRLQCFEPEPVRKRIVLYVFNASDLTERKPQLTVSTNVVYSKYQPVKGQIKGKMLWGVEAFIRAKSCLKLQHTCVRMKQHL